VVRPSIVFGPEDDFFNRFAALARIAPALPLVDGGHTRIQPVYVGDLAEAVVRILADPATAGATFELGGPRVYSMHELLKYTIEQTGRRRLLVPVPAVLLSPMAWFLELLPEPPLTRDQLALLGYDNVVSEGAAEVKRFADLDIAPTSLEAVVPEYLRRFRRGGGLKPSRLG
jgi:NADH dehydrogenase